VEWFQKGKTHTLAQGARVVGAQFGWSPEWLTHRHALGLNGETLFLYSAPTPVLLVPLLVAAFVLWRRRATQALLLLATVSLSLVVGVIAVSRIVGIVYVYRLRWTWVLAMLAFIVVAWTAWMVVAAASRRAGRWLVPGALCALGALSLVSSVSAARARIEPIHEPPSTTQARLMKPILRALPDRKGDVIIRATSPGAGYYKSGLLLRLERDGIRARVDANPGDFYGKSRNHHRGAPVRAIFTVAINDDFDKLVADPGALRLLAYAGDRTRSERSAILARRADKVAQLAAERQAGKLNVQEYLRQSLQLPDAGRAVGVFEAPIGSAP
jgi:hypothetical protein